MKLFKTEVAVRRGAISDYLKPKTPIKKIIDKTEYVFFTEKEEIFLSNKINLKGEVRNITEEDFFNL